MQLQRLSGKICELVDDFSLVCYEPLDVSDGESVAKVVRLLDKCNGHPVACMPSSLINDATELFLLHRGGTDGPSINVDGDNRGAAGRDREPRRSLGRCGLITSGRRRPTLVRAGRGRSRGTQLCYRASRRVIKPRVSPPAGRRGTALRPGLAIRSVVIATSYNPVGGDARANFP